MGIRVLNPEQWLHIGATKRTTLFFRSSWNVILTLWIMFHTIKAMLPVLPKQKERRKFKKKGKKRPSVLKMNCNLVKYNFTSCHVWIKIWLLFIGIYTFSILWVRLFLCQSHLPLRNVQLPGHIPFTFHPLFRCSYCIPHKHLYAPLPLINCLYDVLFYFIFSECYCLYDFVFHIRPLFYMFLFC